MTDAFELHSSGKWAYAEASTVLQTTQLATMVSELGATFTPGELVKPQHTAQYWATVTDGFDFSEADHVPTAKFNRILWRGLMGRKPYPDLRSHVALQHVREPAVDRD